MQALSEYRIVCGRGNIRGTEGPRNAVATGLLLSYIGSTQEGIKRGCKIKPTIIIYTQEADSDLLHEVCSGIEEEGLLFEVHEKSGELDELAHAAAEDSMLGSGIGMSGQRIAMQMRRLPKGHNVFELNAPRFWQCRNLGANSARAVKKMPFKAIYREE